MECHDTHIIELTPTPPTNNTRQEFKAWRADLGPVYIEDIEENLRAGGGKGPFMLTLEWPPGVDLTPPRMPILVLQGMIKCVLRHMCVCAYMYIMVSV